MGEADDLAGRLIGGRYRLRAPIGAGGMGEVWEGYDERLGGRRVVIKMMLDERPVHAPLRGEAMEVRRKRFLREVRTTAAIEHPGIPAVYDAGVDPAPAPGQGRLFIAMQLLHGRELQTLIDETDHDSDPLPVARAAAIGAQIASVLDEVHRHDVVHRDVKPRNLMLTPGGIVKVLDFGVASLLGSGANPRLTEVGTTIGTPPYMSPEQALANTIGPTSDVYALACVLYEVLTGRPPFEGSATKSQLYHHVHTPPPSIREARPDVPESMERLLLAMLAKDADQRPTAADVYETLLPVASEPDGIPIPVDIAELDPCLPFVRPMGGRPRRRAAAPAPATRPAPAPAPAITEAEIADISGRADDLLRGGLFVEAADLLEDARSRADDPELAADLALRLAHVRFIAGNPSQAADLFAGAGEYFARRYGPDDPDARLARYYIAQCRDELGDVTGAIAAFREVADGGYDPRDHASVERHLDVLSSLMRLHAVTRRRDLLRETEVEMRKVLLLDCGGADSDDAPAVFGELDAYVARLSRLLDDS